MCVAMGRRKLPAMQPQSIVFSSAVRFDDPARQDRQARLCIAGLYFVEVEPLAAGVRSSELFRKQLSATRVGFPGDVSRRIAVVKFSQAGEVFLAARIVLPVAVRSLGWRRLRNLIGRMWVNQPGEIHVQPCP